MPCIFCKKDTKNQFRCDQCSILIDLKNNLRRKLFTLHNQIYAAEMGLIRLKGDMKMMEEEYETALSTIFYGYSINSL